MADFNITHEEDWLQIFALSFAGSALDWFHDDLPINHIDSLINFFYFFLKKWPPPRSLNIVRFIYQAIIRLPKEENPSETCDDQPLDCEEHMLEDPLKIPLLTKSLRNAMNHLLILLMKS